MQKNTYYISEVAEITHRHINTIRNYIRRGLITEPQREWNGFRIFTQKHIEQIKKLTANNS